MFVVASDDMQWCEEEFNKIKNETFYYAWDFHHSLNGNIQEDVFDLALLSKCNHSIYDYGTFGFWAAYIAGGHTVLADHPGNGNNEEIRNIKSAKLKNWHFIPAQEYNIDTQHLYCSRI